MSGTVGVTWILRSVSAWRVPTGSVQRAGNWSGKATALPAIVLPKRRAPVVYRLTCVALDRAGIFNVDTLLHPHW